MSLSSLLVKVALVKLSGVSQQIDRQAMEMYWLSVPVQQTSVWQMFVEASSNSVVLVLINQKLLTCKQSLKVVGELGGSYKHITQ